MVDNGRQTYTSLHFGMRAKLGFKYVGSVMKYFFNLFLKILLTNVFTSPITVFVGWLMGGTEQPNGYRELL
jgi:hypothetical protein